MDRPGEGPAGGAENTVQDPLSTKEVRDGSGEGVAGPSLTSACGFSRADTSLSGACCGASARRSLEQPEVTSEPTTAVPTVEPMDRMNCVAEVATPSSRRSTVLCTVSVAVGIMRPRPVTVRKRATVPVGTRHQNVTARQSSSRI